MDDSPLDALLDVHSPRTAVAVILLSAVAVVLAVPILVVSFAISYVISTLLMSLGVPNEIVGLVILVVGLGGGLAVEFLVLVRLYRRFAPRLQKFTAPAKVTPVASIRSNNDADPATFTDRVSALDAGLAPPDDRDKPYQ